MIETSPKDILTCRVVYHYSTKEACLSAAKMRLGLLGPFDRAIQRVFSENLKAEPGRQFDSLVNPQQSRKKM